MLLIPTGPLSYSGVCSGQYFGNFVLFKHNFSLIGCLDIDIYIHLLHLTLRKM